MIDWCNSNQGFLMVVLTFVYVTATLMICYFNHKTISEQKNIAKEQKQIALFMIRNETYKRIVEELHFWRFSNNGQIEAFAEFRNKAEVQIDMAKKCQDIFDILTQINMVLGSEAYKRSNEAWEIIRKQIYPCVNETVSIMPDDSKGLDLLVAIKCKAREEPLNQWIKRLFEIEVNLASIIEPQIRVCDL